MTSSVALALLHRHPSRRWTLEVLAREVGASRSTLAERFAHYLHEPPMAYLARWRLQQGARLLTTTQHSVLEVAGRVGYESEAAFNRLSGASTDSHPAAFAAQRVGQASKHLGGYVLDKTPRARRLGLACLITGRYSILKTTACRRWLRA